MKKMTRLIAFLLIALLLCGCNKTDKNPEATNAPVESSTAPAETLPQQTQAPTQSSVTDGHTMYAGAVEDFMLPLEEHSWDREEDVEFVMLHFTSAVVNNRKDPFNVAAIREIFYGYDVSIHYIIERDGTIRCYIPEDRVAWHAGEGEFGGDEKYTDKMNLYSIGIEVIAIGSEKDMELYLTADEYAALDDDMIGFTDAQYESLHALVSDICQRYDLPMDREHVIGHSDYTDGNGDPGELMDWARVLNP